MPTPANPQAYDVYLSTGGRRFYFRNPNHGVTLNDDNIAWIADGRADEVAFANAVAVHLQSGGSPQAVIDQCTIKFVDGVRLTISNGNSSGLPDKTQMRLYRDFVRDLHSRLAARGNAAIRYTAGYTPTRYRVVLICAILAGLLFVAVPFVLLLIKGDAQIFGLLLAGIFLCWPLVKMVMSNAPRAYTPDLPPEELLS